MPMDVCSRIGLSVANDVNSLHGLYMNTLESCNSTHGVVEDFSMDELGKNVTELLHIQDASVGVSGSMPSSRKCVFQKKDAEEPPEKCFSKCATFPCSSNTSSAAAASVRMEDEVSADDNLKSVNTPSRSTSLPIPLKPVSAMKGSREKRGETPPEKLMVKWAPDVYDPIPTSVSHMVTNNRPQRHSKKNSKNKQKHATKSSSSRSSKTKDKKQIRKRVAANSSNPIPFKDQSVDFCEPQSSAVDFHVGNPDQFCGNSFLKRYDTSLCLSSVAEAT